MVEGFLENQEEPKVILIDWGLFLHRAIFGWESLRLKKAMEIAEHGRSDIFFMPPHYMAVNMMIASMKVVGVHPDDQVIVCIDGRNNWRKVVDPQYKANRKDLKAADQIDWKHWYKVFDETVEKLKVSTPFAYLRIDTLEADDIIAVATRFYKDKICVVISTDSDFEQLAAYPNVRLFSPVTKDYKQVKNPYAVITSKIKKEKTDNLLSPILDEADYNRRMMLVSLLELPKEVEQKALDSLKNICYNEYDLEKFPFQNLIERFLSIYNSDIILTYEKSLQKKLKKKIKKNKSKRKVKPKNAQSNLEI